MCSCARVCVCVRATQLIYQLHSRNNKIVIISEVRRPQWRRRRPRQWWRWRRTRQAHQWEISTVQNEFRPSATFFFSCVMSPERRNGKSQHIIMHRFPVCVCGVFSFHYYDYSFFVIFYIVRLSVAALMATGVWVWAEALLHIISIIIIVSVFVWFPFRVNAYQIICDYFSYILILSLVACLLMCHCCVFGNR